ncbi:hypothetical protein CO058_03640 [candidate division WWE3 bacterium CG_4_9_14_0_2_um_filter_35_11]|uniref:UDP-N-acetylglucosamine 1-carboxyvinyltransferase n=1 Tax=candidate division WWE3 bacterium CG_4_9_14_0_2_um_filter_35_11 TaxID=1975077 RepID=A0A2M8EKZ9_UNCKA|nr:MAG: hypothetical protein COV25_02340 [candidate division WWE3 bacterium CG10_big_fil_rev_8_21_14_0_10_35_32]PJC23395.1 MAG: hypothetical protein CO058_03640 [candidate division WWE3 bacterium CG_4_9_14_0_2_um_filter_35_11]
MNGTVKIRGGRKLSGTVTPIPNKNAIVAAIPAAILTNETIVFHNVPKSTDVEKLLEMMKLLGADIDDSSYDNLKINCSKVESYKVDKTLGEKIRASIMFAGPLLARFGVAEIPVPGGCVLGARSISAHVDVFQKAGVKIEYMGNFVRFTAPSNVKKDYFIWQTEASVTATENLAMYASGVENKFEIVDAACEPHVSQVLKLLSDMGADVKGIGSNKIVITGSKSLKSAEFTPEPDFVDIAGYIVAAAITRGEITIKGANKSDSIGGIVQWFEKFNISIKQDGDDLIVNGSSDLEIDIESSGFPLAGKGLPKLYPRPWPGFPVDVIPVMVTLACKLRGQLLISNWMYETGLDFARELNSIGADILVLDPQRIIVRGPINFKGGELVSPGVIQACKALFLASLCDDVETTIHGVDILKRRYPDIFETYKSLGADITLL